MARTQHIIRQQILELSLDSDKGARGIQEEVSDVFKLRVLPRMEQLFDQLSEEGHVLKIDQLELDLGEVSLTYLREEFPQKVEQLLEQEITKLIYRHQEGIHGDTQANSMSWNDAKLEAFQYLLRSGIHLWNSAFKDQSVSQLFRDLMATNAPQLKALLVQELQHEFIRKRIVYQFGEDQFEVLLTLISDGLGKAPVSLWQGLHLLGKRIPSLEAYPKSWHHQVKEILLQSVTINGQVPTTARVLVEQTFPNLMTSWAGYLRRNARKAPSQWDSFIGEMHSTLIRSKEVRSTFGQVYDPLLKIVEEEYNKLPKKDRSEPGPRNDKSRKLLKESYLSDYQILNHNQASEIEGVFEEGSGRQIHTVTPLDEKKSVNAESTDQGLSTAETNQQKAGTKTSEPDDYEHQMIGESAQDTRSQDQPSRDHSESEKPLENSIATRNTTESPQSTEEKIASYIDQGNGIDEISNVAADFSTGAGADEGSNSDRASDDSKSGITSAASSGAKPPDRQYHTISDKSAIARVPSIDESQDKEEEVTKEHDTVPGKSHRKGPALGQEETVERSSLPEHQKSSQDTDLERKSKRDQTLFEDPNQGVRQDGDIQDLEKHDKAVPFNLSDNETDQIDKVVHKDANEAYLKNGENDNGAGLAASDEIDGEMHEHHKPSKEPPSIEKLSLEPGQPKTLPNDQQAVRLNDDGPGINPRKQHGAQADNQNQEYRLPGRVKVASQSEKPLGVTISKEQSTTIDKNEIPEGAKSTSVKNEKKHESGIRADQQSHQIQDQFSPISVPESEAEAPQIRRAEEPVKEQHQRERPPSEEVRSTVKNANQPQGNSPATSKMVPHPEDRFAAPIWRKPPTIIEEAHIGNAGLALLWPYLPILFKGMNWVKEGAFVAEEFQFRAIHFLQFMATGEIATEEQELAFNKLLVGLPPEAPIPFDVSLTEEELEEAEHLLKTVLESWKALKSNSVDLLRQTFLQKEGIMKKDMASWKLYVERSAFDILLDRLPWSYSVVKLPWMDNLINVEW